MVLKLACGIYRCGFRVPGPRSAATNRWPPPRQDRGSAALRPDKRNLHSRPSDEILRCIRLEGGVSGLRAARIGAATWAGLTTPKRRSPACPKDTLRSDLPIQRLIIVAAWQMAAIAWLLRVGFGVVVHRDRSVPPRARYHPSMGPHSHLDAVTVGFGLVAEPKVQKLALRRVVRPFHWGCLGANRPSAQGLKSTWVRTDIRFPVLTCCRCRRSTFST